MAFQSTYSLPSAPALTLPIFRAATESRTQYTNCRYSLLVISVASIQNPLIEIERLRELKAYAGSSSLGPIWKVPCGMYTIPGGFGRLYLLPGETPWSCPSFGKLPPPLFFFPSIPQLASIEMQTIAGNA